MSMRKLLAALAVLALAACGEDPKPAPKVAPVTPTPQVVPAPKPEAKAPEAPKPDPNKELAARVKRALEEASLLGIDPSASGGKVSLFGTTPTEADRKRAAGVAAKVEGVTSVDNQIKVVKGS
jgi:hypothetical protein